MKKLVFLAVCSVLVFCSCGQKQIEEEGEKIYTEDELGVDIEWPYSGWSEVKNETDGTVTLETLYGMEPDSELTTVIEKGGFAKFNAGAYLPGVSIDECIRATIILSDGTIFFCWHNSEDAWSVRFFQNFEERKEYEVVDIDGKQVRHELIVRTYHIDNALVDLWNNSWEKQNGNGGIGWDTPLVVDKPEVSFPAEGGEETVSELNNSLWWICHGYDDATNVNGKVEYENFVFANYSQDGCLIGDYIDGGWYHAAVPNNGQSNQLIITVEPNNTGKQRHATLELQCCNSFTHIKIYQEF